MGRGKSEAPAGKSDEWRPRASRCPEVRGRAAGALESHWKLCECGGACLEAWGALGLESGKGMTDRDELAFCSNGPAAPMKLPPLQRPQRAAEKLPVVATAVWQRLPARTPRSQCVPGSKWQRGLCRRPRRPARCAVRRRLAQTRQGCTRCPCGTGLENPAGRRKRCIGPAPVSTGGKCQLGVCQWPLHQHAHGRRAAVAWLPNHLDCHRRATLPTCAAAQQQQLVKVHLGRMLSPALGQPASC